MRPPVNDPDANGIRDYKNDVRNYVTINDCVAEEQLYRATITKHIKNKIKAKEEWLEVATNE